MDGHDLGVVIARICLNQAIRKYKISRNENDKKMCSIFLKQLSEREWKREMNKFQEVLNGDNKCNRKLK